MTNKEGFTLIELMITMAIMVFVLALTGPVYNRILTGVKDTTIKDQVYQNAVSGMELIRLDLEHVGLGIARNEPNLPIVWNEGTQTLTLRSVFNNSNQTSHGWALLNCAVTNQNIDAATYIVNLKDTPGLQSMVLLGEDENFGGLATPASFQCPAVIGVYSAYPYDSAATNACAAGALGSFCESVVYSPSAANGAPVSSADCAQGTFNLLRDGMPVVNCVADYRVRFDIDNNINGIIGAGESDLSVVPTPGTAGPLMDIVKSIELVMLVQAGQRDTDLNTNPNTTVSSVALSAAGVTNPQNYRWKVIKVSGKPMSW